MLTLEPPYYEIAGTAVYRDHAVPTQFYYAAPPPRVTRTEGRLMFDLLAYTVDLQHSPLSGTAIPDELGGGFLTMGVDCAMTEAQRRTLLRDLAARTGLAEEQIALFPIPYQKGAVRILALDQFSAPSDAPASPASPEPLRGRPTFVERIMGAASPSLLGDLRAIFSLGLSQDGVVFLQRLYEERAAPIGVVYELEFYGLRPSVEARVTANLSRIAQHFGGGLSAQVYWFKAEVSAGLDFLTERGDITIELTSQATGEEAQKSKELALSLFKDRIVQEMFRPTTPPAAPGTGPLGAAGGGGQTALVTLTLSYRRTEEQKIVTYDFRERAPEKRVHSPQGFLRVLLSPADMQQRVHQVDLRSDFFELLQVLVTGPTKEEFAALGVRQVEATLTYGEAGEAPAPERQTLLFRPDSTGDKTFAAKRSGRRSLSYSCALTYEFTRQGGTDADRFRYELPARAYTSRVLRVNPYDDFGVLDVQVEPGRIHPDVREVDVALAYRAPDGQFSAEEHLRLTPGATQPPGRWQVRTREKDLSPYTATYTFVFQDGTVYEAPPQRFTDPLLRVDSPFRHERQLLIRPNVTSPQITQLAVELEYHDAPNNYHRHYLIALEPPFATREVRWPILDPSRQTARYRVTAYEPGFVNEGEWTETPDPSIIAGSAGTRMATIQVRLIGPPLAEAGLDALLVKVALAVAGAPAADPQSLMFDGSQTSADVKFALPPGAALRYRYQTTAFKKDGQVTESDWREMTASLLVISTRAL